MYIAPKRTRLRPHQLDIRRSTSLTHGVISFPPSFRVVRTFLILLQLLLWRGTHSRFGSSASHTEGDRSPHLAGHVHGFKPYQQGIHISVHPPGVELFFHSPAVTAGLLIESRGCLKTSVALPGLVRGHLLVCGKELVRVVLLDVSPSKATILILQYITPLRSFLRFFIPWSRATRGGY